MSRIMFFATILAVIIGANFYVFWHLWHMIPQGNPLLRWALLVFAAVAVGGIFVALPLGDKLPMGLTSALYRLGTSWFFIMLYFVLLFLVADILRMCGVPLRTYMFDSWTGFAVSVAAVAVVMIAGNISYYNKKRVELTLETGKTVPQDGLKIVAVSDLHLGYAIGKRELSRWVELINAENPDLVLIAGDAVDNSVRPLVAGDFASELRKLRSKYGVYAVVGNHEYIGSLPGSLDFLGSSGVNVLRDKAVLIDSAFYVLGRDDRTNTNRESLAQLTGDLDRSLPIIAIDHQPYELEKVERNGIDLQVFGHTHRGQLWPISWITDAIFEKSHGYLRKGLSHIYVSSGLGIWGGKYRIGTRSEYVVITLK